MPKTMWMSFILTGTRRGAERPKEFLGIQVSTLGYPGPEILLAARPSKFPFRARSKRRKISINEVNQVVCNYMQDSD